MAVGVSVIRHPVRVGREPAVHRVFERIRVVRRPLGDRRMCQADRGADFHERGGLLPLRFGNQISAPRSSSLPHRPQFDTFLKYSSNSSAVGRRARRGRSGREDHGRGRRGVLRWSLRPRVERRSQGSRRDASQRWQRGIRPMRWLDMALIMGPVVLRRRRIAQRRRCQFPVIS